MKLQQILIALPLASAFVITEQSVSKEINKLEESGKQLLGNTRNALDEAIGKAADTLKQIGNNAYHEIYQAGYDVDSWLEGSPFEDSFADIEGKPHHPPHEGDPHDPPHGPPPHDGGPDHPPHHGKPPHPPHHGKPHHPHPGKSNLTIYQMISESKYTTKLAKLIDEHDDLVQLLNGTKANYTVFAPTDEAFDKIPEHGKKPSKKFIKDVLLHHISNDFYPAGRVLHSYTIPSLYEPSDLGHKQRLTVRVTLKGPAINFYSRLVATDIFATNGVIHGVDSILHPPPNVATIIDLAPGEFSTLELALSKTGLYEKMSNSDYPHQGGTLFAPSNFAFKKLGPKANAFLFSKYGQKYLKALLKYHIVVNQTLYSDAFFDATSDDDAATGGRPYHLDLPTVLGKHLAVDIARYGPFLEIRVNGFSRVSIHNGIASDGVIQVVSNVLIPPKPDGADDFWVGEDINVEELKARLEPYISGQENMEL